MMLKAEPWVEPAKGAGKESSRRCLLCAAPTSRSGAMSWICPRCQQPVFFAEKVSSLGKNWHRFCLKCPPHMKMFTGETSLCPGCEEPVYFAEKVMSLGRNWHRPCLRCQRCRKTLTAGSHAEHDGVPYCHIPCYGYLFGPKGVNIGDVGCYIYDPVEIKSK
ncbi:cysteine-rich protein 3 isoform X4 [Pteropus medius]|uniref:cysteine-rich protein 3 isoform X4 n=1 Tax=Pteropus vampyrus TaxID=132908 RepID=UPI00196B06B6|nr:cysteine-rich protein 3 isoform X4 [Pteropus giganteus]